MQLQNNSNNNINSLRHFASSDQVVVRDKERRDTFSSIDEEVRLLDAGMPSVVLF